MSVAAGTAQAAMCMLTAGGGKRHRHYWEHMEEAGIDPSALAGVEGCPFRGPFYQLMRQFLLAAYLRQSGIVGEVDVASIGFMRNRALYSVPPHLAPLAQNERWGIIEVWNSTLNDVPTMKHWTIEELMASASRDPSLDLHWRNYLRERYDV